ncbi:PDZ domain-containing protein [Desemzia sp. RIT804]|uniref:SepM family pheromone-processing serine protease n=1 Tax=Desemzia sp. RIT 804 TaxID=2810209 RepID=UPI00194EE7BB|nr:SepM family pheromone-processing serine protease [Desemzia sp. RIT 804]MBM6613620.1 PDZ domain-containing protein [Desemzia sp. RIT 804]
MNKKIIKSFSLVLIIIAIFWLLFMPLPYYVESPGSAVHLNELVQVDNETDQEPGSYMLTTVAVRRATPLTYLTKFLPFHDGYTEEELFGTTTTSEEYNNLQQFYMTGSINSAVQAAFEAANEPYEFSYNGVYVMSVLENSNFEGMLQVGDIIIDLDGNAFKSSQEFIEYVQNKEVNQTIEVTYQRNGEENTVSAPLMEMEETKYPGLGISLVDNTSITTDIPVEIDADGIGGPSAGFMFALQIYTQLVDQDLRDGHEIAGTGTIAADGTVGRIGGIEKKVVAANDEGATIFFAPDDVIDPVILENYPDLKSNYEEAVAAAEEIDTDMTIVPVKNIQDAIDYLNQLN